MVTTNGGESRNRGMDRGRYTGSSKGKSMDNGEMDSNMVQDGAAPQREAQPEYVGLGYPKRDPETP